MTFCVYSGYQSAPGQTILTTLASLTDVNVAGATTGQVLTYSGGTWIASTTVGGGTLTGSGSATAVAFWNGASSLSYDSGLYWDNTNKRLGIGTTTPGYALDVNGYASAINFYQTSDRRLKSNIASIGDGLSVIKQLRPVTFNWKKNNRPSAGLIAQEVEPVLPDAIVSTSAGVYSLDYIQTIPYLIRSVQQLKAANDNLEHEVRELKARLKSPSNKAFRN